MILEGSAVAQLVEDETGDGRIAGSSLPSHYVVSWIKALYLLLSTGSTQEWLKKLFTVA